MSNHYYYCFDYLLVIGLHNGFSTNYTQSFSLRNIKGYIVEDDACVTYINPYNNNQIKQQIIFNVKVIELSDNNVYTLYNDKQNND